MRLLALCRGIDAVNRTIGRFVHWLLLIVVILGAGNALVGKIDQHFGTELSSNAYLELQWYLFGVTFLLGSAHALRRNTHVRVDVLYDRVASRTRRWIDLAGHTLFLVPFCVFMLWISWGPVAESWRQLEVSPDPEGLPRYPLKTVIPVAFALLGLQGLSEIVKTAGVLRGVVDEEEQAEAGHL